MNRRRGEIPGSHIKGPSRTRLAEENRRLRELAGEQHEAIKVAARRERDIAKERETSGLRGFVNRVKRVLTRPIAFSGRR